MSGFEWAREELQPLEIRYGYLSRNWDLFQPIPDDLNPDFSLDMPAESEKIIAELRKACSKVIS